MMEFWVVNTLATPPITVELPLRLDEMGTWRVGKTRVSLETVIMNYKQGSSPEEIVENFDVLELNQVYQIIGYYLTNRDEVDAYIAKQEADAEEIRREMEQLYPPISKAEWIRRYNSL
jgi:uncharacterized protein (DUF433 family)